MTPIELSIFISQVEAVCSEMGVVLRQAAFSPNIKDRLDFSCALFDEKGVLFSQAAHIPVHLGSMAYAMSSIVDRETWQVDDVLVVNDPYLGGTHLPDVTMIAPVFCNAELIGFVANRAHHANIGSSVPGSMPISRVLEEEGRVIAPTFLYRAGEPVEAELSKIRDIKGTEIFGDFAAQISANRLGLARMSELLAQYGSAGFRLAVEELNNYGERLAKNTLSVLPRGEYSYSEVMDDDGVGNFDINIQVCVSIDDHIEVDFTGTSKQVEGNINCPISVAAAAVYYVFRCLLPPQTPACGGTFRHILLSAPEGCLVNAQYPAAVAAGNVETSMRIVDAVLGALYQACPDLIPAASQGTMNNVAMGNHQCEHPWDYYETIAGGMGASLSGDGPSASHSHMTNTLNTPVESVEMHFPLRITRYEIRDGSGGAGQQRGGDGLIREFEFLDPAEVTVLSERRRYSPWGIAGGDDGGRGANFIDDKPKPGKFYERVVKGQRLRIETPGGGGAGKA